MKKIILSIILGATFLFGCSEPVEKEEQAVDLYNSTVQIVIGRGHGSGVVVEQGVLTAAHVVDLIGRSGDYYEIRYDNGEIEYGKYVKIRGEGGTKTDWALLPSLGDHPPVEVYCGPLKLNQKVRHIRYPGVGQTEVKISSMGDIISLDVGVPFKDRDGFRNAVGLDVTAGPGSSGGPIFDDQDRLIGLLVGVFYFGDRLNGIITMTRLPEEVCP
jgi:S1-C subfamily serine protease